LTFLVYSNILIDFVLPNRTNLIVPTILTEYLSMS